MFGKKRQAKNDFTVDQLPSNHWQSFIDISWNRFGMIVALGSNILLFSLPLIIHLMILNMRVNLIYENTILTAEEIANSAFQTLNYGYLIMIPLLMILGVCLSGTFRIIRKLIWQEGVSFKDDFVVGVRQNYKPFLFITFFIGLILFVFQYLIHLSQFIVSMPGIDYAIALTIVSVVYLIPVSFFVMIQTDIYNLSFLKKLKNSFILALATFLKTMMVSIAILIPWLLLLIPNVIIFLVASLILIIVVLPIELLGLAEYIFSVLDQYINLNNHPSIYQKGIWK